jgi:hypothetical protein
VTMRSDLKVLVSSQRMGHEMKLSKSMIMIAMLAATVGCVAPVAQRAPYSTATGKTQAQMERDRVGEKVKDAFAKSAECAKSLSETDENFQKVSKEILYASDTSPYKLELMASKKRLSSAEKAIFTKAVQGGLKCREIMLQGLNGTPLYTVITVQNNRLDGIYLKLITGEYTVGDANQAKSKAVELVREEIRAAQNNFNSNLQSAHNQEVAARQTDSQRMHEYLMQQQRIQAQQDMQRSQQNILLNPPVPSPAPMPTRTNCFTSRDGYTTCTTN